MQAKRRHCAAHHFGMLLIMSSTGMPFERDGHALSEVRSGLHLSGL
jgi:hypothetical protein